MSTIIIDGITKNYGNTRALDNVSITLEPNRIYGLLGRNGAGKTTLLNLMTNKIFPTSGDITIDGVSIFENDRALGRIFYMTEKTLYPEGMRVGEVYRWTREFYPYFDMDYATSLSEKFGLDLRKKMKSLSTGYTSISKVIAALASNAEILIFDEPVLGLDANFRDLFYRELIEVYNENPRTIIISTHLIEEVADVLEEAVIIKNGSIIKKQPVEQLLSSAYVVSGEASKVDRYIENRNCVDGQMMGRFKAVTVLESVNDRDETLARELGLEFSKVELQKLFISLTN